MKAKKYILMFAALVSSSIAAVAQDDSAEGDGFKILHDDPYINMVNVDIGLLNGSVNAFNANLFTSAGATIVLKDFYMKLDYKLQLLSGLNSSSSKGTSVDDNLGGMSIYQEPSFFSSFGGVVSYPFYKEELVRDVAIHVKNDNGKKEFHVPSTYHFGYNIDLGYELGSSLYAFDGTNIQGNEVFSDQTATTSTDIENTSEMSTMFDYAYAAIGLSKVKQHYFKGDFDGYGKKSTKGMSRIYAHVLVLTSSSVDDILIEDSQISGTDDYVYRQYELNETISMLKVGGRVGWESISMSKLGLSYGVEAGFQPGPVTKLGQNAYFEFRTKLTLGAYSSVK